MQPLEYATQNTARPRKRWPWYWIVPLGFVLLCLFVLFGADVRQVETRIDTTTGTLVTKTVWFNVFSQSRMQTSAIEDQLKNLNIQWKPNWQFLSKTHYHLLRGAYWWEDGATPVIYQVHGGESAFVLASTPAELRDFVHIMETGTDDEQEAAAKAARDKAIGWINSH